MRVLRLLLIAATLCLTADCYATQPMLVMGTYQKGSNLTEPRPKRSDFLETLHGGVVVMGDGAGYYLFTRVIKSKRPAEHLRMILGGGDGYAS